MLLNVFFFFLTSKPMIRKGNNLKKNDRKEWHSFLRLTSHFMFYKHLIRHNSTLILPHIVTARIRSMTGRYCFHRCLSVNISGGGYLVSDFWGGYLVSDLGGGTWSQIFGGGTWSQIFGGGYLVSENCYGYTAGSMPLAFTQEDFLVLTYFFLSEYSVA